MAFTELTVHQILRTGIVEATPSAAAVDGNKFLNDGRCFVKVTNGDSGDHIVTIKTQQTVDGLALVSPTVTVAAGATKLIGPFGTHLFDAKSGADRGEVELTYDGVTAVTITAYRL